MVSSQKLMQYFLLADVKRMHYKINLRVEFNLRGKKKTANNNFENKLQIEIEIKSYN